ncbi:MAG: hypothetical protein AB3N22_04370 [Ruegeria sp.]
MIVVCNGMLRSGSSLQFNLARLLVQAAGHRDVKTAFVERPTEQDIQALVAQGRPLVLKTHHFPLHDLYQRLGVRVLYCHRDLRDVAASIRKKWNEPFDEILDDLNYMRAVQAQLGALPDGMLLSQPYALLSRHPDRAAQAIATHLDLDLTLTDIRRVADQLDLRAVQRGLSDRSRRDWAKVNGVDPITYFHHNHISADQGQDGTWRTQFSQAELRRLEDVIAGPVPTSAEWAAA